MAADFTTLPDTVDTGWTNPLIALYQEQSEAIGILDELAVSYGIGNPGGSFADAPLPSQIVHQLCELDPVAIQTAAVRLHRTTQQRFATLADGHFQDLLADSWSGDLADQFRDWVEGGGSYQGINVYFAEVRGKAEATGLVLVNLGERLKTTLEELDTSFREQFAGLEDVAAKNGSNVSGVWGNLLAIGGAAGTIIGAIFGNVITILIGLIMLVVYLIDNYRVTAEDVAGSIQALGAFHGAVSGQAGSTGTEGEDLDAASFEGVTGDG